MESLEVQRKQEITELKTALEENGLKNENHTLTYNQMNNFQNLDNNSTHNGTHLTTFTDSKINYIRSMFLQYLSCKDPVVKPHIESALIAIFRYSDEERTSIDEVNHQESQDTITAITTYLGTSIINNFTL